MEFFKWPDISRAEEKAELYQQIVQEVGKLCPIMLINAQGEFIYASNAFLDDMGLTPDGLQGRTAYDLVAGEFYDRSPSLKALAAGEECSEFSYSRDGSAVLTETRLIRHPDGSIQYVLCHAVKPEKINQEVNSLRKQLLYYQNKVAELEAGQNTSSQIIYQSHAMERTVRSADRVAQVDAAVMITGESGVGKDLFARRIHEQSPRASKPFVPVCIPMISPSLLESELFGYVDGAFTGSSRKGKIGLFESANGGTVFLDEIGDIPLELQVKLLRVLENQEITKVGSTKIERLDIRIISATNKDLQAMVAAGTFREDLYYRIGVIKLHIPPLCKRDGDVPILANFFLGKFCDKYHFKKSFSPAALKAMTDYAWPGNVRQLRNVIEQAVILSDYSIISAEEITGLFTPSPAPAGRAEPHECATQELSVTEEIKAAERQKIMEALIKSGGNKKKAAQILGMSRSKLYRKLELLDVK